MALISLEKGNKNEFKWHEKLDRYLEGLFEKHASVRLYYGETFLKTLRLPDKFDLGVSAIDLIADEQGGYTWTKARQLKSLVELRDFLQVAPPAKSEFRLFFLNFQQERWRRNNYEREGFQAILKVLVLFGCALDIDYDTSVYLFGPFPKTRTSHDAPYADIDNKLSATWEKNQLGENFELPLTATASVVAQPAMYQLHGSTNSDHFLPPLMESSRLFYARKVQQPENYMYGILACSITSIADQVIQATTQSLPESPSLLSKFLFQKMEEAIIAHTRECLSSIRLSLGRLRYESREYPFYTSLNYILHVQDTLTIIHEQEKHMADKASKKISPNNAQPYEHERARLLNSSQAHEEFSQLASALHSEASIIYSTIKDRLPGKDSSRNKLFIFLGGIYLPFTLASGILGMNIKEFIGDGAQSPRWWALLAIGGPLALITVVLPMYFDKLIRLSLHLKRSHPRLRRAYLITMAALMIGLAISVPLAVASNLI